MIYSSLFCIPSKSAANAAQPYRMRGKPTPPGSPQTAHPQFVMVTAQQTIISAQDLAVHEFQRLPEDVRQTCEESHSAFRQYNNQKGLCYAKRWKSKPHWCQTCHLTRRSANSGGLVDAKNSWKAASSPLSDLGTESVPHRDHSASATLSSSGSTTSASLACSA